MLETYTDERSVVYCTTDSMLYCMKSCSFSLTDIHFALAMNRPIACDLLRLVGKGLHALPRPQKIMVLFEAVRIVEPTWRQQQNSVPRAGDIPHWLSVCPWESGGTWMGWHDWMRGRLKGSDDSVGWDQAAGECGLHSSFSPGGFDCVKGSNLDPDWALEWDATAFSQICSGTKNRDSSVWTQLKRERGSEGRNAVFCRSHQLKHCIWLVCVLSCSALNSTFFFVDKT